MSAEGNGTEQTPPVVVNNDHGHNKGPAPKAPGQKSKITVVNMTPKERDPRKLNQYLMPAFNEIVGEPGPGIYSFDSVWSFSSEVMKTTMDTFVSPTTYAFGRLFSPMTKKSNEVAKIEKKPNCSNDVHLA